MGDLGIDTTVVGDAALDASGEASHFSAMLSREWEIWGPMGGYLASFALRAAGRHCRLPRPASIVGHFLGVARFDSPVDITCTTQRTAKTAQSVRASVTQEGRPIFEAMVWATNTGLLGLEHQYAPMPEVEHWSKLVTIQERLAAQGEQWEPWFPFWENLDQRPPYWRTDWMERPNLSEPPVWDQWLRFRPTASFDDPWVDACRLLVLVDLGSWPSAQSHHNQEGVMAPSIDLACEFHRIDPTAEWLFVRGVAPSATEGLVASHQSVWADDGRLLASGISQLLCRPMAGGPQPPRPQRRA